MDKLDKKKYDKIYRLENRKKLNKYKRKYYYKNIGKMREKAKVQSKKYREKYPGKVALSLKKRKKLLRTWRIKYWEKNPDAHKKAKLSCFKSLTKIEVSFEEYSNLFKIQNNQCAICGGEETRNKILSLDHSHETKKIRGLLCSSCNSGLGFFKDSPGLLLKAIKYLSTK